MLLARTTPMPCAGASRRARRRAGLLGTVLGLLVLAGCASYGTGSVRVGQTPEEVAAAMGPPTGRYTLPDGRTRLEYARGPMGRHTYMIDLDANGRVQQWAQVLDEAHFAQVVPGLPSDQLLLLLGRPAERRGGGLRGGETWSWRYPTNECLWFQVSVEDDGRVRDGGSHSIDPSCDPGSRRPW